MPDESNKFPGKKKSHNNIVVTNKSCLPSTSGSETTSKSDTQSNIKQLEDDKEISGDNKNLPKRMIDEEEMENGKKCCIETSKKIRKPIEKEKPLLQLCQNLNEKNDILFNKAEILDENIHCRGGDFHEKKGDYIVRRSEIGNKMKFVLSINCDGKTKKHIVLNYNHDKWYFEDVRKSKLEELLDYYKDAKLPLSSIGVSLINPVKRPSFYYLHESITSLEKIGEGAFGEVSKGIIKNNDGTIINCAIKVLKAAKFGKQERTDFMTEAATQRCFNHINIVRLLGIAPFQEPIMMLLELAPKGALNASLRKRPKTKVVVLEKYAFEAINGIKYLHSKNVIHRDIAARNCLLGENDEIKISDFGLTILGQNSVKEEGKVKFPIRYCAPETLRDLIFTQKTDIFSYGILLWEIFTYCKNEPYPGLSTADVRELTLSNKKNMEPVSLMPEIWKIIFKKCLNKNPEKRLDANEIINCIEKC
uniref:non-specific protein-tyrosine kinase n=1 Tax=Parastrongyloides trichosuri TaxID=131310 RepID=A0A0N4Z2J9_PARTI